MKVAYDGVRITDTVINEESFEVYDEQSAMFARLTFDNLTELLVQEKEKVRKEAIADGFLDEAEERAKILIEKFLLNLDFTDITVYVR